MLICNKCNKEFKTKQQLTIHNNRKKPCNIIIITKCEMCLIDFKTSQGLERHINRKNKCIKINLEERVKELEEQVKQLKEENEKLKNTISNTTNINNSVNDNRVDNSIVTDNSVTNNIILNNFGCEDLKFITKKFLTDSLKEVIQKTIPLTIKNKTQLKVEDLNYLGMDIEEINMFRLFINLIFKNNDYPENKTIKYEEECDTFYYYDDNKWYTVEKESKNILLDKITKKIQLLLLDKKPFKDEYDLKKLELYLGEDYNLKKNKVKVDDYGLLYNGCKKTKDRFNHILRIEYKNPELLDNHRDNII
jgi:hypothetical protein